MTAGSVSTTYGTPAPPAPPTITGLQNGEDPSVLGAGLSCTTTADASSPVGSYTSSCDGATDPNYTVSYVDGTVVVTPASVTVTASSASFTYGSSPPAVTPTVTGLVGDDTASALGVGLTCGTSATATTPVGPRTPPPAPGPSTTTTRSATSTVWSRKSPTAPVGGRVLGHDVLRVRPAGHHPELLGLRER